MRGIPPYDHIVIETTGIAEPKAIRANFQAAEDYGGCFYVLFCCFKYAPIRSTSLTHPHAANATQPCP